MLPVGGMPIAVLAAKRAGNTGIPVVVATSTEASDDAFSGLLELHGLSVFRGPLDNTLSRFTGALAGLDDETIVFRLTADNVVPDGALLEELEAYFVERRLAYAACSGVDSGLPYGVSVEVTRAKYLREAAVNAVARGDLEHVTPYIVRKFGAAHFSKYKELRLGRLRCTVDNFDDYLHILRLFDGLPNADTVPAFQLINRLALLDDTSLQGNLHEKLVLGTAQFGLNYGIANSVGKPDAGTAHLLIKSAIRCGVTYLDTARAYGDSENIIGGLVQRGWGGRFKIITKLSPLPELEESDGKSAVFARVDASVFRSCAALGVARLDVLMLHRASHLSSHGGNVWRRILELQRDGVIGSVGISVQNPAEALLALEQPLVAYLQLPFNLLDSRWDAVISQIHAVKAQRKLVVHVRSSLLQGLLTSQDKALWRRAHIPNVMADQVLSWLQEAVIAECRDSVVDLCVSYVVSQDWVDGIVLGMETAEQLQMNLTLLSRPMLTRESLSKLIEGRPVISERALDPAGWLKN